MRWRRCASTSSKEFGAQYLPEQPNSYASKAAAQEAHEAIRPSNVGTAPSMLVGMESDAVRLYEMIWRQFVACQMPPAEYTSTTVDCASRRLRSAHPRPHPALRRIHARAAGGARAKTKTARCPISLRGEALAVEAIEPVQHFTKPPPRYGEASLVRELEKRGIGRPSTYAAIISTIQERGYVTLNARRFHAEKIGELVTDDWSRTSTTCSTSASPRSSRGNSTRSPTATADWREVLDTFYGDFSGKLNRAQAEKGGMRPNVPTNTDIPCSVCGRPMQIRTGSTGVFLGCSGYALPPKERCTHTLNLIPGDEVVDVDADAEGESRLLRTKRRCPVCARRWTATWSTKAASCTSAATIRTARAFASSRASSGSRVTTARSSNATSAAPRCS